MRGRASLTSIMLFVEFALTGAAFAFQSTTVPAPFDVQISLTPTAATKLASLQEGIVVTVSWSGNPAPGAESHASQNGKVDLGTEKVEASGRAQTVHVSSAGVNHGNLPFVQSPIQLKVTASSTNHGIPDNILACDTFDGKVEDVTHKPVSIHCSLNTENANNGGHNNGGLGPIPPNRAADTYAIYALLAPGGPDDTMSPSNIQNWSLADTTVSIDQMNPAVPPNGQLQAPSDDASGFDQALRDYEVRKNQRFRLQSAELRTNRSFDLINEQQIANLRQVSPGNTGVAFFSAVYFNNKQTAALVYVNLWCANLCSAGQWVYLEKRNGQWVRRSGVYG